MITMVNFGANNCHMITIVAYAALIQWGNLYNIEAHIPLIFIHIL